MDIVRDRRGCEAVEKVKQGFKLYHLFLNISFSITANNLSLWMQHSQQSERLRSPNLQSSLCKF